MKKLNKTLLIGGVSLAVLVPVQGGEDRRDVAAHGAGGGLVEERGGVGREELALAAGVTEAQAKVLGGVVGDERLDLEPANPTRRAAEGNLDC